MQAHDVQATIEQLGGEGSCEFGSLNQCTVGVARFSAHPLWERHSTGDELLHVIEGTLDLTVLAEDGPVEMTLGPWQVFLVDLVRLGPAHVQEAAVGDADRSVIGDLHAFSWPARPAPGS